MKKTFTFLIALFSISSIFAQSRSWNSNDRHQTSGSGSYGQSTYDNHNTGSYDTHTYGQQPAYNSHDNSDRMNNDRSQGYRDNSSDRWNNDRSQGYHENGNGRWGNDRNSGYYRDNDRHDAYDHHSVNTYERRNAPVYYQRDDRYYGRGTQRSGSTIKAVGAGLIVGGIIALMAGSH